MKSKVWLTFPFTYFQSTSGPHHKKVGSESLKAVDVESNLSNGRHDDQENENENGNENENENENEIEYRKSQNKEGETETVDINVSKGIISYKYGRLFFLLC